MHAACALRRHVLELMPDDPGEFFDLFRNNPPARRMQIDRFVRSELADLADLADGILMDHDFWSAAAIVRPPGIAGEIGLYTDWTMVDEARFRSGLLWLALDDTTEENGSLHVVPGTHRLDVPYRGRDIHFAYDGPGFAEAIRERSVRVDVPIGHAAVCDNRLLHGSGPNRTDRWRVAVALGFKPLVADLRHYRCQPGNRAAQHRVRREFYLDYDPFEPDFDVGGPTSMMSACSRSRRGSSPRQTASSTGHRDGSIVEVEGAVPADAAAGQGVEPVLGAA